MFKHSVKFAALVAGVAAFAFAGTAHAIPRGEEFAKQIREAAGEQAQASNKATAKPSKDVASKKADKEAKQEVAGKNGEDLGNLAPAAGGNEQDNAPATRAKSQFKTY
ncbi:MAG: hypothetical protein EB060_02220 [Proteobacteria bacterium]|nr:hypothetical protein [Pseudomonadota bacterium]